VSDSPDKPTSKKLEAKRARRLADERKAAEQRKAARRRSLITMGLALVVGAVVVFLIISQRVGPKKSNDVGGPTSAAAAGCTAIETHPIEGRTHVPEGTHVDYKTDPPTSGNHWPPGSQAGPGFYATPVESERLVHNLEHGQIVIWYKPDAPQDVKDKLEQVTGQDPVALIAVPYDYSGPGEYALTAWGVTQECGQVSQTVIDDFRKAYQGQGPEKVTPPFTG
jgi:hypothetical protein